MYGRTGSGASSIRRVSAFDDLLLAGEVVVDRGRDRHLNRAIRDVHDCRVDLADLVVLDADRLGGARRALELTCAVGASPQALGLAVREPHLPPYAADLDRSRVAVAGADESVHLLQRAVSFADVCLHRRGRDVLVRLRRGGCQR
jgi:hypothetical protein